MVSPREEKMMRVREFEDHDEERECEYQVGKVGDPRYIDDGGIDGAT
jgi:hypothetical protein